MQVGVSYILKIGFELMCPTITVQVGVGGKGLLHPFALLPPIWPSHSAHISCQTMLVVMRIIKTSLGSLNEEIAGISFEVKVFGKYLGKNIWESLKVKIFGFN